MTRDEDYAACRAAIRVGSRTFHAASLLLPMRVREPALALYAFCREADDAIDGARDAAAALVDLQRRLDACYRGTPREHYADRALADVVERHAIPRELPGALLEGFAWDASGRNYQDLSALRAYAVRVAGTVGIMMSLLMGVRSARALARAADLGVAMQLSNVARDVGEDLRLGRVYLPAEWLAAENIARDRLLAQPVFDARVGRVVDRLVCEAESLYVRAASGIVDLPPDCRPAIHAARLMYAEIGREVSRRSGDSISGRAVVSSSRKAVLLARALSDSVRGVGYGEWPVLPEARYLLDAVQKFDVARGHVPDELAGEGALTRGLVTALAVLARLEQRDRLGAAGAPAVMPVPTGA